MTGLAKIRDLAFGAFGIAIGYAGNIGVPQLNLQVLGVGLLVCALAYFVAARSGDKNYDACIQTLFLSVGAIAIGTSKFLSAVFTMLFIMLGAFLIVAVSILDLKRKIQAGR
jgi:hypothetical protein